MLKGWQGPPKPYKKGDIARECHDFGSLALRVIVGAGKHLSILTDLIIF
jgi:hypothetical protein